MSEKPVRAAQSKYKEEYCELLIEHMKTGLSFESFSAVVGVHRDTVFEWAKVHENFKDAKARAFDQCLLFWEKEGIEGLYSVTEYNEETGKPLKSKAMNSAVWTFNMKNRFKWRDRQMDETDVVVKNVSSKITDEELDAKIQEKLAKIEGSK